MAYGGLGPEDTPHADELGVPPGGHLLEDSPGQLTLRPPHDLGTAKGNESSLTFRITKMILSEISIDTEV